MGFRHISKEDHIAISSLGMSFAVSVVGCVLLGYWLDTLCGTIPVLTFLGMLSGFALGMYLLVRIAKNLDRKEKEDKDGHS